MTPFQSVLIRIALGSAMFLIGVADFRKAAKPDLNSYLDALDEQLLGHLSDEVKTAIRRATAALLIVCGAAICATAFFSFE